jgi:hypothetical protein
MPSFLGMNAVAESLFASLKVKLVDRTHVATRAQARMAVAAWIAQYNARCLHSWLSGRRAAVGAPA